MLTKHRHTKMPSVFTSIFFLALFSSQSSIASSGTSHALWNELMFIDGTCSNELNKQGAFEDLAYAGVKEIIRDRTSLIQREAEKISVEKGHHPFILAPDHQTKVDVTNALFLQYGQNIILESKDETLVAVNRLVDTWKVPWRVKVNELYTQKLADFNRWKQNTLRAGKTVEEVEGRVGMFAFPLYQEQYLFPKFSGLTSLWNESLEEGGNAFAEALSKYSDGFKNTLKSRLATRAIFSLAEEKDFEIKLEAEEVKLSVQGLVDELKQISTDVSSNYAERAAQVGILKSPTDIPGQMRFWSSYLSVNAKEIAQAWTEGAPIRMKKILETLRTRFPVDERGAKNLAENVASVNAMAENFSKHLFRRVFSDDGLTLQIPSSKIYLQYNVDLGTTVATTEKDIAEKNPSFPVLLNIHGAGTTKSSGQSFKSLNTTYYSSGFLPFAVDMPVAGLGPIFSGPEKTVAYMKLISKEVRSKHVKNPSAFLIYNGRSSGAYQVLLDSLLDTDGTNADIYVGISLSNPETIDLQFKNVQQQLKAGLFSGAIQESLENAADLAGKSLAMLRNAKKKNPNVFNSLGVRLLLKQGTADADGGPSVVKDLEKFIRKGMDKRSGQLGVSELAAIRIYEMPENQKAAYHRMIAGEEVWIDTTDRNGKPVKRKVTEDMLEGTHFIDSNSEDNPGFSYPRAQMAQSTADTWSMVDMIADGIGEKHTWPDPVDRAIQERAIRMREGMLAGTPYHSLFERFVAGLKIDIAEVDAFQNPRQNTGNYVERMANSKKFWEEHKVFLTEHFRNLNLI